MILRGNILMDLAVILVPMTTLVTYCTTKVCVYSSEADSCRLTGCSSFSSIYWLWLCGNGVVVEGIFNLLDKFRLQDNDRTQKFTLLYVLKNEIFSDVLPS